MDLFENISRAYLAVRVTPQICEKLSQAQRHIYEAASSDERKVQSLPKDALNIPVIDLGEIKLPALEAAQLALERALASSSSFSVELGAIEAWPNAAEPQLLQVLVTKGQENLHTLRNDLTTQLAQYGFDVRAGTWTPHLPITRIKGTGPEFSWPEVSWSGPFDIEGIALMVRREDRRGRMRFFVDWECAFSSSSEGDDVTSNESEIRADIRAQLEERLQQRGSTVRPPRRRLRVKDIEDTIDVDAEPDGTDVRA